MVYPLLCAMLGVIRHDSGWFLPGSLLIATLPSKFKRVELIPLLSSLYCVHVGKINRVDACRPKFPLCMKLAAFGMKRQKEREQALNRTNQDSDNVS